jgi:4,4'-diaponeurosporenoate glycosyltransferase
VTSWAPYLIGWALGWVMLWRLRGLPSGAGDPGRAAVIVPARNEAAVIDHVLRPLLGTGADVVVVDDRSTDDTAGRAARAGARVVSAPQPDGSWLGKPHACAIGVAATTADVLVFLDADVRPPADLPARLVSAAAPGDLVTVQPWHHTERWYEQGSVLFNIVALMGCSAFTPFGRDAAATVAFGPVIAAERATYGAAGGHAAAAVRRATLEDVALARAVGRTRIFSGRSSLRRSPELSFRMHPAGPGEMIRGWTRSIAGGASSGHWWATLAVAVWVWSVAGGWLTWPWAYPMTAVQVWVLGRKAGRFHALTAALFPLAAAVFVVVVIRSAALRISGRSVRWKDRRVSVRR